MGGRWWVSEWPGTTTPQHASHTHYVPGMTAPTNSPHFIIPVCFSHDHRMDKCHHDVRGAVSTYRGTDHGGDIRCWRSPEADDTEHGDPPGTFKITFYNKILK